MMTVGELIEALKQYEPTQVVYTSESTGNYWHDVVAYEAKVVGIEKVKYSEYNRAFKIIDWNDDSDEAQEIVVIG